MTRAARFTVPDLTRAIRAFEKAGYRVAGGKIAPDGSIEILTSLGDPANDRGNPLDRLLGG